MRFDELIYMTLVGLMSGWLSYLMTQKPSNLLANFVLGLSGAVLATFVASFVGILSYGTVATIIVSGLGAVGVLFAFRARDTILRHRATEMQNL